MERKGEREMLNVTDSLLPLVVIEQIMNLWQETYDNATNGMIYLLVCGGGLWVVLTKDNARNATRNARSLLEDLLL